MLQPYKRIFRESTNGFRVILLGTYIGGKSIRSLLQLKGQAVDPEETILPDISKAKETAKRMNGLLLSPGEKRRYVVAKVQNGVYTGD